MVPPPLTAGNVPGSHRICQPGPGAATMPRQADAPRDLLLGLLALQNALVTRDQLVLAFASWTAAAGTPLVLLLTEQRALKPEHAPLLKRAGRRPPEAPRRRSRAQPRRSRSQSLHARSGSPPPTCVSRPHSLTSDRARRSARSLTPTRRPPMARALPATDSRPRTCCRRRAASSRILNQADSIVPGKGIR